MKELVHIQSKLKAPKNQVNKYGGYKYRSCEDILEALTPLLAETGCHVTLDDDIIVEGNRIYVKATATITNCAGEKEATHGFAREEETKKGMDASQITGSASSYARKYALNGLFCIDDTKDVDATNTHGKKEEKAQEAQPQPQEESEEFMEIQHAIMCCANMDELQAMWTAHPEWAKDKKIVAVVNRRKGELSK